MGATGVVIVSSLTRTNGVARGIPSEGEASVLFKRVWERECLEKSPSFTRTVDEIPGPLKKIATQNMRPKNKSYKINKWRGIMLRITSELTVLVIKAR